MSMGKWFIAGSMIAAAGALMHAGACAGLVIPPAACIGLNDVINIEPGTATGNGFAGTYEVTASTDVSCEACLGHVNAATACQDMALEGEITAIHEYGVLVITDANGESAAGAVDADGNFRIGSANFSSGGEAYQMITGRISGNNVTATSTTRVTVTDAGGLFDRQSVRTITLRKVVE